MMETRTTEFMGSVKSAEVEVALKASSSKLTIKQFVAVTGFKIDEIMFNEFWQVVVNKMAPHVGGHLLEWLGYEGESYKRKEKFIAYLKRNGIAFDEISFNDKRVAEYVSIQKEIKEMTGTNCNMKRAKWLIMDSRDFKKAIMKLSTKRGDAIREYYLRVEELIKLYVEYDNRFETRKLESEKNRLESENVSLQDKMDKVLIKLDELKDQNMELMTQNEELKDQNDEILGNLEIVQDKLSIAKEDRVPKTVAIYKRERFVLFNKNNDRETFQYYVIRGQQEYCSGRLISFGTKYPLMKILIDIEYQPNAINLFNRFKERYSRPNQQPRFRVSGNNVSLGRHAESMLINIFHSLNDEKKQVDLEE